jgi:hypothetical protein
MEFSWFDLAGAGIACFFSLSLAFSRTAATAT